MVTMTYSNLNAKGFKDAIKAKKYGRYVMLYLYDGFAEFNGESVQTTLLFSTYGEKLNTLLGENIALLTVYDKYAIDVAKKYTIPPQVLKGCTYQESMNQNRNHFQLMKDLAKIYDVKLPALVLVDTNETDGSEEYAKISFDGWKYEEMFSRISDVISVIKKCPDNFRWITTTCQADVCKTQQKLKATLSSQYLEEIIEEHLEKQKFTRKKLAEKLDINVRTLRRYLKEGDNYEKPCPLPRDTALAIAFILKMMPDEANKMFDSAIVEPIPRLGDSARDTLIRDCLRAGLNWETANEELRKRQYEQITVKK